MRNKNLRPWKHSLSTWLIFLSVSTSATSVSSQPHKTQSQLAQIQKEIEENRRKWLSKAPRDYHYTIKRVCHCTEEYRKPLTTYVRDGAIKFVLYAESGQVVDKAGHAQFQTVEGLFAFIQTAINKKYYSIEASYDPEFGYPASAHIDYSNLIADDEEGFVVEGFISDDRTQK